MQECKRTFASPGPEYRQEPFSRLVQRWADTVEQSLLRRGTFRESNLLRQVFEATVERCLREDLVSGEGVVMDSRKQAGAAMAMTAYEDFVARICLRQIP